MRKHIALASDEAVLHVSPSLGGAILKYSLRDGTPLFRPTLPSAKSPFDFACILMAPWCNRISGGGFHLDGVFHQLSPNMPDQAHPIHGNAFQRAWRIVNQQRQSLELELICRGPGPYHYMARVRHALDRADLVVDLGLWHSGESPLPYGIGLHPWLVKQADTSLQFSAREVVSANAETLPVERLPLPTVPEWQFEEPRCLPTAGIDNAFAGWNGRASVHWFSRRLRMDIQTDPPLNCCHVFTPGEDAEFFCFEPTTHLPNAHNWPAAEPDGLRQLEQGDTIELCTRFSPRAIGNDQ